MFRQDNVFNSTFIHTKEMEDSEKKFPTSTDVFKCISTVTVFLLFNRLHRTSRNRNKDNILQFLFASPMLAEFPKLH